MPRPLVIGNGKMLMNFDEKLQMRDLYYPYVGQLNHIGGQFSKVGIWVEDQFSWLDEDGWERSMGYQAESLVTDIIATHQQLGVKLTIADAIHQRETIYLKRVVVENLFGHDREIRLFFHLDLSLSESEVGDTAVYDPLLHTVYHYKRNVYVLANGATPHEGMFQYSVGIKRFNHAEGTWRDAEDGWLQGNSIAQGSVDSTISFRLQTPADGTQTLYYWICVGDSYTKVKELNQYVLDNQAERLLNRVQIYWREWVNKNEMSRANLSEDLIRLYKQSLLIVRTQIDQHGAILAANDSDILQYNRDHYSYTWPRDGALIAHAMGQAGYDGAVTSFYEFCSRVLSKDGYLLHKFNPDGSLGSSWHPYIQGNEVQLPIQEDETALVLFALWEHYRKTKQIEFCQSLYASFIRPAAKFLHTYIHPQLNLPLPSYDLWEERRGIFTFTASTVYAGLMASAHFAKLFGDEHRHIRYKEAAERVKQGMLTHLYDEACGRFLRGIYLEADGSYRKDYTVESSLFGVFSFGVLPANDPRVEGTMEVVKRSLLVQSPIGGYARYQGDYYFRKSQDIARIPGNPWIICTLWVAEWEIAKATSLQELDEPLQKLQWVARHAMESGVLPEQVDPLNGAPVSVAPLTWSHSTYVLTVVKYTEKYHQLLVEQGGSP